MTNSNTWALPFLGSLLALFLVAIPLERCRGADPKILPVKFSDVDASKEIDPAPQGGGTQLLLRKIGYEELHAAVWRGGQRSAALLAGGADPNATSKDREPILFYAIHHGPGRND